MTQSDRTYSHELVIPSDLSRTEEVLAEIERVLQSSQFSEKEIFGIRLALEEALVNAMKHGNQLDQSKMVAVAYGCTGDRFDIRISDEGPGFNPSELPDPTDPENWERPCGRGVFLMKAYMHEVSYSERGNTVIMSKLRNGAK